MTLNNVGQRDFLDLDPPPSKPIMRGRAGAFTNNMALPVHRWFRYSAGFSAQWAESVIAARSQRQGLVFDPFVGSGTTLIAAQRQGAISAGVEHHSFVWQIAEAKLLWTGDEQALLKAADNLVERACLRLANTDLPDSALLARCYASDVLRKLEALRCSYQEVAVDDKTNKLIWLAITSILRECSSVGTAQWQYILPKKSKTRVADPLSAFSAKVREFSDDIFRMKTGGRDWPQTELIFDDARCLSRASHLKNKVGFVLTSPPYLNNFDYADATRLELTFWGELDRWAELQDKVRFRLIRSCSQHASAERLRLPDILSATEIEPIKDELLAACGKLEVLRETRLGRKAYHTMVAAYFVDMAKAFRSLKPLCIDGAELYFVIGDSAPYGVHIPADEWLTRLAVDAGFKFRSFEKLRDRNLKWKNRKHRVPLMEGVMRLTA